jgi:dihydrodipicolinate synthase/N-acetylneuraminate lyase
VNKKRSVVAIPPSYDSLYETLEINSTSHYLKYLYDNGVCTVMSTAGTSQFNLLSMEEIHQFNSCISDEFDSFCILGIPPVSTVDACKFARESLRYMKEDDVLMALYPDRFYDRETILNYVKEICNAVGEPIYLHAQKMRNGIKGDWNYDSEIVNELYHGGFLKGIKEECPNLMDAYNFVLGLENQIDVIVAGGSMRRFSFLELAGANSFLSGVGNLFPSIERNFFSPFSKEYSVEQENKFFNVFLENGWHPSLRTGLKYLGLTCFYDRRPWPKLNKLQVDSIIKVIEELKNELP